MCSIIIWMIIKIKKNIWKLIDVLPNKIRYFISFSISRKQIPNLLSPRDYSEYIFRDILLNRNHDRFFLADKYLVRNYVADRGLSSILTKTYGVWEDANEIDFNALPNSFVLKCNHSCGMNIICFDKSKLNIDETKKTLNKWLKTKHPVYFETHYSRIKPLIFCEEYICDTFGSLPIDYKIHCANGLPVFIQVCTERSDNNPGKRVIYDCNWNNLNFVRDNDHHYSNLFEIDKPINLKEMLEYSYILSSGMEYCRLDFYNVGNRVYFGEVTLTPMGGWLSYFTNEAQLYMGNRIKRESKN